MDATRALLDQLMGKDRNLTSDEKPQKIKWSDSSVCQNFLAGFCVNALFTNTKSDLGPCHLSHEPSSKAEFDAEPERVKQPVIANFIRYLETLAYQCDQQMKRNQQRVQLEDQPLRTIPDPMKETQIKELETKINQMNDNIKTLLTQMETLGEEGKIDESQGLLKLVEGLRKEKADLEVQKSKLEPDRPTSTPSSGAIPEKKLKVCEICSAFLVSHDAEARWQSHATGKQHMGYALIRDTIKEYKEKHKNLPEPATDPLLETRGSYNSGGRSSYYDQPRGGHGGRGGFDRGYDRNSDRGYDRDRDRGYDRYDRRDRGYDRDRDYGRDRDRDSGRERDRDYGRDRDRSERDRERRSSPRRDRSRSRSRSRSKGKK